jgi:lactoylglutathione lyase
MSVISLNLIVLRTAQIESALAFYAALGLHFAQHQHGTGALHYASTLGAIVMELYPQRSVTDTTSAVRIGFAVADLAAALARLEALEVRLLTAPHTSPWGMRAVVADPDGHRVELTQRSAD